jgi:hypothetical protein
MKAYGHSTDARSAFLQETGGCSEQETGSPSVIHEEYGWEQPPQFSIQLQPQIQGVPQSLPPANDSPTERWSVPRRTG